MIQLFKNHGETLIKQFQALMKEGIDWLHWSIQQIMDSPSRSWRIAGL